MITEFIREHDGDGYVIEIPEGDEIQCACDRIMLKEEAFQCDICDTLYCPGSGTKDYRQTGWFICIDCQSEPELIIDALVEQF